MDPFGVNSDFGVTTVASLAAVAEMIERGRTG
jgi:hypothetical protein